MLFAAGWFFWQSPVLVGVRGYEIGAGG